MGFRQNTTGARNTAIGHFALEDSTTADNNTAVGYVALTSNTTEPNVCCFWCICFRCFCNNIQ